MERFRIAPVSSRADRRAFIRLPFGLYDQDPDWVPPLNRDMRGFLDVAHHPFYEEAQACFFLARQGSRVVGRIAAIRNRAHERYHGEPVGFFGFFETIPDERVSAALVESAAAWLRDQGLDRMRGPFSPSTNYVSGLLVDGDAGPPVLMMPHNPPWYATHLEATGLGKCMDLLAFWVSHETLDGARWRRIAERAGKRAGCTFRPIDMKRFDAEVRLMIDIYHDAWSDNWGFVPMNDREVAHMAAEMKPIIHPGFVAFAMVDGKEVGYYLALPDYNRVLRRLKGRLFPTGVFRLLLAKRRIPFVRLLLMGVRKSHHKHGLDSLLYLHAFDAGLKHGVPACEASWVLESNPAMVNAMLRAGGRHYRTYRVYERPLSPA